MLCGFSQHSKHADKRQIQQDFLEKLNENIWDFSSQRIVWKSLGQVCKCVCLTLDLTVIPLISAGLRLNYFGLTSVHLRVELGLLKVWMLFLSSWGIFWQWLCRSCLHAMTCLHNKPPLYYLALDISAMKNHFLTLSSLPRRYNPLVPIAHTLDAVVQLLTRALCFCHHVTCSLFSFCWRQQ